MKTHELLLIAALVAFGTATFYAAFGQQTQPPVTLILDGQPVASLSNFDYDPNNRELKVDTEELLFECREGRIFIDRFED